MIRRGGIRTPYTRTYFNKGFRGEGIWELSFEGKNTREGRVWQGLLARIYHEKTIARHPTYRECTMDSRWDNFQLFCEDIQSIPNYTLWKNSSRAREYCLDKDKLVPGNKHYSKDTCLFLEFGENVVIAKVTGEIYEGYRISDGYTEEFTNQREFCRKYNLAQGNVTKAIHVEGRIVKGWLFRIKLHNTQNPYVYKLPPVYIAKRLCDNYIEKFTNQTTFAKKHGLQGASISRCLKNQSYIHKGWTFKIKEETK